MIEKLPPKLTNTLKPAAGDMSRAVSHIQGQAAPRLRQQPNADCFDSNSVTSVLNLPALIQNVSAHIEHYFDNVLCFPTAPKQEAQKQMNYLRYLLENPIEDPQIKRAVICKLAALGDINTPIKSKLLEYGVEICELEQITRLAEIPLSSEGRLYSLTGDSYDYHRLMIENDKSGSYSDFLLKNLASPPASEEFRLSCTQKVKASMELDPLKEFLLKYSKSNKGLAAHLYKTYYLTRLPNSVRKICQRICDEFGTKLFVENEKDPTTAQMVYEELSQWKKASNGSCKFPTLINLNKYEAYYLNNPKAGGHCDSDGSVHIKEDSKEAITFALRHELAHLNDTAPKKDRGIINGVNFNQIQWRGLYRKEFFRAGLSPSDIEYAYRNKKEFIAVAAAGDCSRYSKDFKRLLYKLGLPKYVFSLPPSNPNYIKNAEYIAALQQKYPQIQTLHDLKIYFALRLIDDVYIGQMPSDILKFVKEN